MDKSPAVKGNSEVDTPGIGVAGVVMCPYFRGPCLKSGCELWVELRYGDKKVGRCSIAWQSILQTELRQEIEKLRQEIERLKSDGLD